MKKILTLLTIVLLCFPSSSFGQIRDSDRLGMALDYFNSRKYHEALIIFERLDSQYQLNARFHAYMGICYYQEQIYDMACKYFDEAIPQLGAFSPSERASYLYVNGESHVKLREYDKAFTCYEQALALCKGQDRMLVESRMNLCRMMLSSKDEHPQDTIQHSIPQDIQLQDLYEKSIEVETE